MKTNLILGSCACFGLFFFHFVCFWMLFACWSMMQSGATTGKSEKLIPNAHLPLCDIVFLTDEMWSTVLFKLTLLG